MVVAELLDFEDEEIGQEGSRLAGELLYQYDFVDDWKIRLTKHRDFEDLLAHHWVGSKEVEEAKETVIHKHKPVCLCRNGVSVMDDVGGLSEFANFLGTIYEGKDKEEAVAFRRWAKSMGWNQKKTAPKNIL